MKISLRETAAVLSAAQKVVITAHTNPDGDAIGSSLGLMHFLKSLVLQVHFTSLHRRIAKVTRTILMVQMRVVLQDMFLTMTSRHLLITAQLSLLVKMLKAHRLVHRQTRQQTLQSM